MTTARSEKKRKCATCGAAATCRGRYENATNMEYACDTCCGHGNEDGVCKPVRSEKKRRAREFILGADMNIKAGTVLVSCNVLDENYVPPKNLRFTFMKVREVLPKKKARRK